jgi:hypothetical protein
VCNNFAQVGSLYSAPLLYRPFGSRRLALLAQNGDRLASAGQVTVPMLADHQGVRSGGVLYKVSGLAYLDVPPPGTPAPPTIASWEVLVFRTNKALG